MAEQDERPVPAEGRSRGPIIHSGGEQDIGAPLPPYEGRQTSGEGGKTEHFVGEDPGPAPPREVSKEESEGVPLDTDTTAATPLGVGEAGRQGNEEMVGASDEDLKKARMGEGLGRQGPIDPESPDVRVGDQGG